MSESNERAMKIVVMGAGVQGTLYGVRLARAGHDVTLVARGKRALELRDRGAVIQDALRDRTDVVHIPVIERLTQDTIADLCFVTIRREQLTVAVEELTTAPGITRFVFMVNHANGSEALYTALRRERVILGFPGAAGGMQDGVDRYVDIREQRTAIESSARDVAILLHAAGFRVERVHDMDAWLRRHAVFVTAIAGALYAAGGDPKRLGSDLPLMRTFVLAVREGWAALDRRNIAPPPVALRTIFCRLPLPITIAYWRRLLRSPRGELYFALHTRHAPQEMAALAADVRSLIGDDSMPNVRPLYRAIDEAAAGRNRVRDLPDRSGTSHVR